MEVMFTNLALTNWGTTLYDQKLPQVNHKNPGRVHLQSQAADSLSTVQIIMLYPINVCDKRLFMNVLLLESMCFLLCCPSCMNVCDVPHGPMGQRLGPSTPQRTWRTGLRPFSCEVMEMDNNLGISGYHIGLSFTGWWCLEHEFQFPIYWE